MKKLIRIIRNWREKQIIKEIDFLTVVQDNRATGGNRIIDASIVSGNILDVSVAHNGTKLGQQSEVTIGFGVQCGCMYLNGIDTERFYFTLKGEMERDILIRALDVIVKELKENE